MGFFEADNSDWTVGNDPCAYELGSGWRIPTQTEWENIITAGGWEDPVDAFNSDLKLHMAGGLDTDEFYLSPVRCVKD